MSVKRQPLHSDPENESVGYNEGDFEPEPHANPPDPDDDGVGADDFPGTKGGGSEP